MRQRKRVLIWAADAGVACLLRLVLDLRGYAVEVAEEEARVLLGGAEAVLLVGLPAADWARLEMRLWRGQEDCGVVIAGARGLQPEGLWIAQMLQDLRTATFRKRGPKPLRLKAKQSAAGYVARIARLRAGAAAA